MTKDIELSKREKMLILVMRKLKFGKIEVDIRDGVPQPKIKQKEKIIDLDKTSIDNDF